MKLSLPCALLLANGLTSALPTSHGVDPNLATDLALRSINEPNQALQVLERRIPASCQRIGTILLTIGTSQAKVAFINGALGLARRICEDEGNPNCSRYISYVQDGLNLIFVYQAYAHGAVGEGDHGTQGSQESGTVKRDSSGPLLELGAALQESGFSFDSVEHVDVTTLDLAKRDSDPVMTQRAIFRNLVGESGYPSDVAFNQFNNGDVNMDYAGDFGSLPTGNETAAHQSHNKRYDGRGFKIAWTSRKTSLLTRQHQHDMSRAIANDWVDRAFFSEESDYMGLVKTDHTANFYFRIIPELTGFGLNYEDVNLCGGMASFL